jgi:hypothetical protein
MFDNADDIGLWVVGSGSSAAEYLLRFKQGHIISDREAVDMLASQTS